MFVRRHFVRNDHGVHEILDTRLLSADLREHASDTRPGLYPDGTVGDVGD